MPDLVGPTSLMPLPAREDVSVRAGTMADLAFIDALQKKHSQQVGWMPTKTLEGKITRGEVIVAELPPPQPSPGVPGEGVRVGYCIGVDRYFKREDVGIVYQINVAPVKQRAFIGATLLKAMFDRAAYGCRLFCCWCAQDIEANRFWEAMGFVPLAFRAGSEKKARVHIFWQKRIRAGDVTTPYWFPSQTTGGSIREDRLVLPIPPGTHWSDAKPMILPKEQAPTPALRRRPAVSSTGRGSETPKLRKPTNQPVRFGPPPATPLPAPIPEKQPKPKKPKVKNDPKLIAAARELRDRWLEQVNAPGGAELILPRGKYDVSGALPPSVVSDLPALPVAA